MELMMALEIDLIRNHLTVMMFHSYSLNLYIFYEN